MTSLLLQTTNVPDSYLVASTQRQISSDLAGEAVILDLQSGVYYGLNEVGAKIWELIQQPKTISEICSTLLTEYDVDPEVCKRDLLDLLKNLEAAGLVEVSDAKTA